MNCSHCGCYIPKRHDMCPACGTEKWRAEVVASYETGGCGGSGGSGFGYILYDYKRIGGNAASIWNAETGVNMGAFKEKQEEK